MPPAPSTVIELRGALLNWYDAHARDLPWRRDTDPYRVWVSEVMLQQTRVETVIPYYERWLARFPDAAALAEASEDQVLQAWAGLGYYRRARALHSGARILRERHGGVLPDDPDALRELPGVGSYTAGAIASIAFGRAEPAVDGNARRVLARLLDRAAPSAGALRELAARLVDAARPGEFNQALMELGATVCTPRAPRCGVCPVAAHCAARAAGTQEERPARKPRPAVPAFRFAAARVQDPDGRLLLVRRPEGGLLAGMWEFPQEPLADDESPIPAAARAASRVLGQETEVGAGAFLGDVAHTFSHRKETYRVVEFRIGEERPAPAGRWVAPGEIGTLAVPAAQRRIAELPAPPEGAAGG